MNIYDLQNSISTTLRLTTIRYLMEFGEKISFEIGEMVFREGDPCQQVYIILNGEADIIKDDAYGNGVVIATAQQGSVFGEMGMFLDLRRSGSVVAKTPLTAMALQNDDFIGALQRFPDLSLRLFKSLSLKLDSANARFSSLSNSMGMIQVGAYILEKPVDDSGMQHHEFHAIMAGSELKRYEITHLLTNYKQMAIIDKLQFSDDGSIIFQPDISQLRHYLQHISLDSAQA